MTLTLWRELQLDQFWVERLAASRKGTRWDAVLFVLVAYRLLAPGSEWRLHRQWFERSALADLLGADFALAEIHKLYACHDRLLAHKQEEEEARMSAARKNQIGSGDRSEKIRTYNFPQNRVTDHRIGLTLYDLQRIMNGDLDPLIEGLLEHEFAEREKGLQLD